MEKLTSRRNPVAVHLKKLGVSRSYRVESGEFLCDGLKLLEEAVKSGAEIVTVLTAAHLPFPLPVGARVYQTQRDIFDSLSPLKNAQSILFACKMPPFGEYAHSTGTHILLDGIQDPGNLGTIIRTADAMQIDTVILTGGCADVYNPKTVRASMGAIFRQKLCRLGASELTKMKNSGAAFVGTASGSNYPGIGDFDLRSKIVAIGSEGRGLSSEVLELCNEVITIPISPECESLNAATAAAIVMWEASKFRIEN